MNRKFTKAFFTAVLIAAIVLSLAPSTPASAQAPKKKFTVLWSIYAGWQPWDYAQRSGILKKWADKYNIQIDLRRMDYLPSVEALVAKKADACVMTNMEALDMPATAGVNVTSIIAGDFSNGNDALLVRNNLSIKGLAKKDIFLVELSVSHYLLARCLNMNGMQESDVNIINTSDSDIAPAFIANKPQQAVITWNPLVMQILQEPGITKIFDSSQIPGEILDLMVVRNDVLKANPDFGKALVGAWYEVMDIMSKRGPTAESALAIMAESAGCSVTEYKQQLKTTAMYYTPQSAADFTSSEEIKQKMDYVRNFCFKHNLLGENAKSVDDIGIQYPDGTVQGSKANVRFIFDASFMRMAAEGKLK
jgi:NitT/TauT family transport system substrate-binding protein